MKTNGQPYELYNNAVRSFYKPNRPTTYALNCMKLSKCYWIGIRITVFLIWGIIAFITNFSDLSKTGLLKLLKSNTDVVLVISRLEALTGIGIVELLLLVVEFVATKAGGWGAWTGIWVVWTGTWGTWTDWFALLR